MRRKEGLELRPWPVAHRFERLLRRGDQRLITLQGTPPVSDKDRLEVRLQQSVHRDFDDIRPVDCAGPVGKRIGRLFDSGDQFRRAQREHGFHRFARKDAFAPEGIRNARREVQWLQCGFDGRALFVVPDVELLADADGFQDDGGLGDLHQPADDQVGVVGLDEVQTELHVAQRRFGLSQGGVRLGSQRGRLGEGLQLRQMREQHFGHVLPRKGILPGRTIHGVDQLRELAIHWTVVLDDYPAAILPGLGDVLLIEDSIPREDDNQRRLVKRAKGVSEIVRGIGGFRGPGIIDVRLGQVGNAQSFVA
jgi:hypothetical protein